MVDLDRRARALARSKRAIIQKGRLGDDDRDPIPLRGPEAISLVHRLTLESWSLAGRAIPVYPRERIPIRFV